MAQHGCLLCAPLTAKTVDEMVSSIAAAEAAGANLVELRVDHLKKFTPAMDLPLLLNSKLLPVIVTYRPKWEGGEYEGEELPRLEALQLAASLGADFVDVELQVAADFIATLKKKRLNTNTRVIVSNHNYEFTPSEEEIGALASKILSTGADIVKITSMANDITDVARAFQLLSRSQVPTIMLVMGPKGLISRLLCPKFGGFLTFGTLGSDQASAPGQPTLYDLRKTYRFGSIGRYTKVYGIIGNPVGHSKSPLLHNAAFADAGIDAVYVPLLVDDLAEFLRVFDASDFAGFSVTIPHKEAAWRCADELHPLAKSIGAVNTLIRKQDGKLIGYNTDCLGAITAIEDGLRPGVLEMSPQNADVIVNSLLADRLFVVIGAGGAGKALAFGAKVRGAEVIIANRNLDRAKVLAGSVGGKAISLEELETLDVRSGAILANSTSVGMQPNVEETPISMKALKGYSLVFDSVYTPQETRLLREAREVGAMVVSGLEMFIRQAIGQFELFTDKSAPHQLIRSIITKNA